MKRVPSLKNNLTEDRLQDMEIGELPCDTAMLLPYQPFALSKAEWCYVTRLRAGKTLDQVAKSLKLDSATIDEMESGRDDEGLPELVTFWEKRAEKSKKRAKARRAASASV